MSGWHTTGPWLFGPTGPKLFGQAQPFVVSSGNGRNLVAACFGDGEGGIEAAEANARLIAAAPEMFAALVVARSTIRRAANTAMTTSGQRDFNAKADMLDATIAKAKGGAA